MLMRFGNGTQLGHRLREDMESLFGKMMSTLPEMPAGPWRAAVFPAINVWETDDDLFAEAELPGMSMEDVEVFVMGEELSIRGARKAGNEEDAAYHRRERGTGAFHRVLRLPAAVDAGAVEAHLSNGVLSVRLPKAPEAKPRKIEIKVAQS